MKATSAPEPSAAVLAHGDRATLFRHISAEKASLYRAIMDAFARAARQFRPFLRPDEVRAEARWDGEPPSPEEVQQALSQLADWGNLRPQADTARVASLEDFYRARFLYSLSHGGEAVEAALETFVATIAHRAELQSTALEDILVRLESLKRLAKEDAPDEAKVHEVLRDLSQRLAGLAANAQAFMADVTRRIELQRADVQAVMAFKTRLIDYLQRFIADLVTLSPRIAGALLDLQGTSEDLLAVATRRDVRDAAPVDALEQASIHDAKLAVWRERWMGLQRWFLSQDHEPSQSERLRARANEAIPQLLLAIATLNERRSGKSDRAADFRVLARWFAECADNGDAHRLARAAFALSPTRHLARTVSVDALAPTTPWAQAPAVEIHPRLRERGSLAPKGTPPKVRDRSLERELLARQLAEERAQLEAAQARFASGGSQRLSELGWLDRHAFRLLLALIGEALAAQRSPDETVDRLSGDGTLRLRLEPLPPGQTAVIDTEWGRFRGRDHRLSVERVS